MTTAILVKYRGGYLAKLTNDEGRSVLRGSDPIMRPMVLGLATTDTDDVLHVVAQRGDMQPLPGFSLYTAREWCVGSGYVVSDVVIDADAHEDASRAQPEARDATEKKKGK